MVSDRIQKERRTQFTTESVEDGEFVDENGKVEETETIDTKRSEEGSEHQPSTDDSQHRPIRPRTDSLATSAPDVEDEAVQADQQVSQVEALIEEQSSPEDQVVPKKGYEMGGTSGGTFETPSVPEERLESEGNTQAETGETSQGEFQTISVPQEQPQIGVTSGDKFETPSLPQGELKTEGTSGEELKTKGTSGGAFVTPSVPMAENGGPFQTADGSLIVSPPYVPPVSYSPSYATTHYVFAPFVAISIVTAIIALFYCNKRWPRCRRRQRQGEPWANEIKFHDEYDITDEDSDAPEDYGAQYMVESQPNGPIDSFGGAKSSDWLGDMNFAVGEGKENDQATKKADEFDFDEEKGEASDDDPDGNSLSDLLNGESILASESPPPSPLLKFAPEPEISPPTVSEVFKSSMSPHWKNGKKPTPMFGEENTFEELQQQQGDLNQALFLINDNLLEQQRALKEAEKILEQKTTRRKHRETTLLHKTITEEIARLESEKDDIDAKIKATRTKLKAQSHNHRLKLFDAHE